MKSALAPYYGKRDFKVTSEPQGGKASTGALSFVVQKHAASRLHYDFRLELDGTLKSWAVPKGPSLDPGDKRMAVHVEDHPIDYGGFEGTIPKGQYGAGEVIVWDNGTWEPVGDARAGYRAGKLKFRLDGKKLHGGWTLVRMHGREGERQEPWLLIKEKDDAARPSAEYSVVDAEPKSVLSDRTIADKPSATPKQAASDDSTPKSRTKATPATKTAAKKASAAPSAAKAAAKTSARASTTTASALAPIAMPAGATKAKLPATLGDLTRRPVTAGAEQNAAYGDPPVTVACGSTGPAPPPDPQLFAINGICWYAEDGKDARTWVLQGREVPLVVRVPTAYTGQDLVDLSTPIRDAVAEVAQVCRG